MGKKCGKQCEKKVNVKLDTFSQESFSHVRRKDIYLHGVNLNSETYNVICLSKWQRYYLQICSAVKLELS